MVICAKENAQEDEKELIVLKETLKKALFLQKPS
jgi:hypothetical protein